MNNFTGFDYSEDDGLVNLYFKDDDWKISRTIVDVPVTEVIKLYNAVFPSDSELEKFGLPSNIYLVNQQIDKLNQIMTDYKALVALANGLTLEELQTKLDEKSQQAKIMDDVVRESEELGLYND